MTDPQTGTVAITGGSGFIGSNVVDTLIGAQPGPIIRARVDGALARRA